MIRLPRLITPYSDRDLDCQMALEDAFTHLVDQAQLSNWTRTEAIEALRELAFNHLCMEEENRRTEAQIRTAIEGLTKH